METPEFIRVGRVKDAHGIRGELFVVLFAGEAEWIDELNELKELRLVKENEPVVRILKLKSARIHKNGFIAKTEDITDRNEAETLKGWMFEVPADFLVSEVGDQIYLREIQDFKVVEKSAGEIGKIVAFGTNGQQDLLVVKTAKGEFEIPFVEAFVERIDYENQVVYLDLPVGLLGDDEDDAVGERE